MSQTIDDPPYKTPFIDDNGYLTIQWMNWIRSLFARVGTNQALSNTELEVVRTADIAALEVQVTAIDVTVTALSSTVSSLSDELNQGPIL